MRGDRPWKLAAILFLLAAEAGMASGGALESITDLTKLPVAEAARGLPVRIRAVVIRHEPHMWQLMMQQGEGASAAGIYVDGANGGGIRYQPGELVEVTGRTGVGSYGNIVKAERIQRISLAGLPQPYQLQTPVELSDSDRLDNTWVQVEGVVESALPVKEGIQPTYRLTVRMPSGPVPVRIPMDPARAAELVGGRIRARGVVVLSRMTRHHRHQADVVLASVPEFEVLERHKVDWKRLPFHDAAGLFRFQGSLPEPDALFRTEGLVVFSNSEVDFELSAGDNRIPIRLVAPVGVKVGRRYQLAARVARDAAGLYLLDVVAAEDRGPGEIPPPVEVDNLAMYLGIHDGSVVRTRAWLVDLRQDPLICTLSLRGTIADGSPIYFNARLAITEGEPCPVIAPGSLVEVEGAVKHEWSPQFHYPVSSLIVLSGPQSARVVEAPPLVERMPVRRILAFTALLSLAALLWILLLRHRVRAQTEALRAQQEALRTAKDAAEMASREKSRFLATMSHELRTPMNAVTGMASLLLEMELPPGAQESAATIRVAGDSLLAVIDDVLDFSKIESGSLELEHEPFDPAECASQAAALVAGRAAEKGLQFICDFAPDVPASIAGDVTRLRQILINLLSNAVKFTERGSVLFSLAARGNGEDTKLVFTVRDTGPGIEPAARARLFESFMQADASITRKHGGTGLGLAISKRLVERMRGSITVESEPGQGAVFQIDIPVETRARLPWPSPLPAQARVMVADDEDDASRQVLVRTLEHWGARVEAGGRPGECGDEFDLVFLNASLAAELADWRGRAPVVVIGAGTGVHLDKPVRLPQLRRAIAEALGGGGPQHAVPGWSSGRAPLRILIAEDNVVNQRVAVRLLAHLGYEAEVVNNGGEAVEALLKSDFDLAFLDIHMPGMDGLEAARRVRMAAASDDSRPCRPWLGAFTASAFAQDREACRAAGMNDFLSKPVRLDDLRAAIVRCQAARQNETAESSELPLPPAVPGFSLRT